jgi:hypothetical protein
MELTPDRVKSFCSEASMLHSLAHPNIVLCHGVAVMPPAICLVTEWCNHGSLYDLLHTSEYYIRDSCTSRPSRISRGNRFSMNIRVSSAQSGSVNDNDSVNEITSDGDHNPYDDLCHLEDSANSHNSSNSGGGRRSFAGEIKVVSKRFHAMTTTTRSSLHALRSNLLPSGAVPEDRLDDRNSPLKGMGLGDPGMSPPPSLLMLSLSLSRTTEPDLEKQAPETKSPRSRRKKLKSAASVMQSSRMGYGFGDRNSNPSPVQAS